MTVRDFLKEHILLFDGGMGSYYSAKTHSKAASCELANLTDADTIVDIHSEYLNAGAQAIKTNSFAANRHAYLGDEDLVKRVINSAWENAVRAVNEYCFVHSENRPFIFADMGPILDLTENDNVVEEYRFIADEFLRLGAENFLFETNANTDGLSEIAAYIKEKNPNAFIITSFAVLPDGYSHEGHLLSELFTEITNCPDIDAFGLNCVSGAHDMLSLFRDNIDSDHIISLMPNAGYPTIRNNRSFYDGDPVYFATQLLEMAEEGVKILGGCCGTAPIHIREVSAALNGKSGFTPHIHAARVTEKIKDLQDSPFWNKLNRGEKVIAVELDSPIDTSIEKFMRGAWELKSAGVDAITIADCPIGKARMDSSLLACKIRRELGMDALPHLTCRDRNLNATKALLLGLYAEGIRNVLLVTGDPIPSAQRDEVKSVYQFNSRKLAGFVSGLVKTTFPGNLHTFGALNINAVNFDVQLRLAKEKCEKGMVGFLTQPILTEQAFENLKRVKKELSEAFILGGVMPVVSERNALFMNSEINGITVDPKITALYHEKNKSEGEALAVEISGKIMQDIEPYVDGYYLMTPFGRTYLIAEILKNFCEAHDSVLHS